MNSADLEPAPAPELLIGIDEAGYGPPLGPLVVGYGGTHGTPPLEHLVQALPKALRPADSKVLYRGAGGFKRLEATVLAFLTVAHGSVPGTLKALLQTTPEQLGQHPWYANLEVPLPLETEVDDVRRNADLLRQAMGEADRGSLFGGAQVLLEGTFNDAVARRGNKSVVEMDLIGEVLDDHLGSRSGQVFVDRLGGRKFYGPWLMSRYPMQPLQTLEEHARQSRYAIRTDKGDCRFSFLVNGESRRPEIALGSCIAKYVREIFMVLWNRYWTSPAGISPTAGYPQDARRVLSELELKRPLELDAVRSILIRCR